MTDFSNLTDLKKAGDELKTNCPHCGGKYKLYINFNKRLWHCFKCGKSGRVRPEDIHGTVPSHPQKAKEAEDLPPGESIYASIEAREYLEKRRIKPYREWYYCGFGKYAERIILPVYLNGVYRGFQARGIDSTILPRYLTAVGLPISQIVWGLDYSKEMFPEASVCFITEGIFGSCRIHELGYPSVCAFTKRLSATQASLLSLKYKRAVLAFDRDALSPAIHAGFQLYAFGVPCSVLLMQKKGPDDHTVEELKSLDIVSLFDLQERIAHGAYHSDAL